MILRKITIMMFVLNASVTFLARAGSSTVYGIEMTTGFGNVASTVEKSAKNFEGGGLGIVDAVAGLTVAATEIITGLLGIVFAAPGMFENLGVPGFIVGFVFAPLYVAVAIDILALFRGDSGI